MPTPAIFASRDLCQEARIHEFVVEASGLRLPPGVWPAELPTDLGNGRPFIRVYPDCEGGWVYSQANGCISLHVLND